MTTKMTDQILKIVEAGGGVIIDGDKLTDQLIKLASAGAKSNAMIIIKGSDSKLTDQLIKIAKAGKGRVIFDLTNKI